ncbi:MAG: hypothetical protein MUC88_24225, partial [Planctomycetes bacterium]|nr:hypothetical protein [Planctomycetota bacterium]
MSGRIYSDSSSVSVGWIWFSGPAARPLGALQPQPPDHSIHPRGLAQRRAADDGVTNLVPFRVGLEFIDQRRPVLRQRDRQR